MKRFIAIFLPTLATDRAARRAENGAARGPRVTFETAGGTLRLAALDEAARRAGLVPGLGLAEARARLPDLIATAHDPAGDEAALEALALWAQRWSPSVARDSGARAADGLTLDAAGAAHLFGGEEAWLAGIVRSCANLGLRARAGIADTIGAAWAAARFGPSDATRFPPGETRAALAAYPPAALRLPDSALAAFDRLGLRRIADLEALMRDDSARRGLDARFGPEPGLRLRQAYGDAAEPLAPDLPRPALRARLDFAEPISAPADIARAVDLLGRDLCAKLEAGELGLRRARLICARADGTAAHLALGTSFPMRDPKALSRLFAEHLPKLDPGFGIDAILLDAELAEPWTARQNTFALPDGDLDALDPAELAPLVDRLVNRLGAAAVVRLVPRESHIPERAQARLPALGRVPDSLRGAACPEAPRPLRLLARPEPIEALAELPDGAPRRFRWRKRLHEVATARGPERIEGEWWRGPESPRDYFAIEDRDGRRFWLYREGAANGLRWFLHGLFA
jgi:protein ImuB